MGKTQLRIMKITPLITSALLVGAAVATSRRHVERHHDHVRRPKKHAAATNGLSHTEESWNAQVIEKCQKAIRDSRHRRFCGSGVENCLASYRRCGGRNNQMMKTRDCKKKAEKCLNKVAR